MSRDDIMLSIINAASLLKDKAYELSADIDKERVKNIYITLSISPGDAPSMDITKTYFVHQRDSV